MPRTPSRTAALVLSCVVLLPLTAASCGDEPAALALGTASRATVAEIVEAPGSVTARAAATVTAPANGTLADLRVDAGDRVSKGDVIAVIDSPAAQRRLDDAAAALDQAQRGRSASGGTGDFTAVQHRTDADAKKAFDDARDAAGKLTDPILKTALLAQVTAAEQQYTAASEAVGTAVRSVQRGVTDLGQAVSALTAAQRLQAEQAYALADAAVDALTLKAPVGGIVQLGGTATAPTSSLTDLLSAGASGGAPSLPGTGIAAGGALPGIDVAVPSGAVVTAGTPLLTIVDTGRLGLVAEVDETDVLLVKPGVTATVELEAATGATYAATVRAVDLLPTTSARGGVSYRVRLDLGKGTYDDDRAAPAPRPGMSAIVRLQVREATDAVTVPASAVFTADGRDTVWTVRSGRTERVPVTLGVQGEDVVQIVSGVGDGAQVVVSGTDQVQPGQQVR